MVNNLEGSGKKRSNSCKSYTIYDYGLFNIDMQLRNIYLKKKHFEENESNCNFICKFIRLLIERLYQPTFNYSFI